MRLGLTLPTFAGDPSVALDVGLAAETAGLDGIFVFDHIWPMGAPGRPALFALPMLGALAATTSKIVLGPLVARVGLLEEHRLIDGLLSVAAVAGSRRLIAGLGSGDRSSAEENLAYGLPYPHASERLDDVGRVAAALGRHHVTTWVGGRSGGARRVAAAHADALNVWGASIVEARSERADLDACAGSRPVGFTWGGQVLVGRDGTELRQLSHRYGQRPALVAGTIEEVAAHLHELDKAGGGLDWVVCAPLDIADAPQSAVQKLANLRELLH